MAVISPGTDLEVDRSPEARRLSLALSAYIARLNSIARDSGKTPPTQYQDRSDCRVFNHYPAAVGVPATNATGDSPGQDMCFVFDAANNDLYFCSSWSAAGTHTMTKIFDCTGA